jgi:hypothetical protein
MQKSVISQVNLIKIKKLPQKKCAELPPRIQSAEGIRRDLFHHEEAPVQTKNVNKIHFKVSLNVKVLNRPALGPFQKKKFDFFKDFVFRIFRKMALKNSKNSKKLKFV